MAHIPFLIFSFSYLKPSLLPQNNSCTYQSITLLNCQCNVFLTMYSYYNSCFLKKDCSYRNNCGIRMHDADLEHSLMKENKTDVHMFLFPFLCYGITDLALGILKMLIRVCFRDVLQPAIY